MAVEIGVGISVGVGGAGVGGIAVIVGSKVGVGAGVGVSSAVAVGAGVKVAVGSAVAVGGTLVPKGKASVGTLATRTWLEGAATTSKTVIKLTTTRASMLQTKILLKFFLCKAKPQILIKSGLSLVTLSEAKGLLRKLA